LDEVVRDFGVVGVVEIVGVVNSLFLLLLFPGDITQLLIRDIARRMKRKCFTFFLVFIDIII
jgi:hypothetical protein